MHPSKHITTYYWNCLSNTASYSMIKFTVHWGSNPQTHLSTYLTLSIRMITCQLWRTCWKDWGLGYLIHFPVGHFVHPHEWIVCDWMNVLFLPCTLSISDYSEDDTYIQYTIKIILTLPAPNSCSPSHCCLFMPRCWQKLFVVFPSLGEWQETGVKWENEM